MPLILPRPADPSYLHKPEVRAAIDAATRNTVFQFRSVLVVPSFESMEDAQR